MILDLMRHASTGRAGHLDGRQDPPLLRDACAPLLAACAGMGWSRVFASPRLRTRDTALALATPRGLAVDLDPRWVELDFGEWDGQRADALPAAALAAFHADPNAHAPPGGERWDSLQRRTEEALRACLCTRDNADASEDAPVLVVSHGGPLRAALMCVLGWPTTQAWSLRLGYGTRLRLRVEAGDDGRLWGELLELRQP